MATEAVRRPCPPNRDAILYVSGLHEEIQEHYLREIFSEHGRVCHVHIPRDAVTNLRKGFGFVEYRKKADAEYAFEMMNLREIKGRTIVVNSAVQQYDSSDIGANLFVGNLDPAVTEMMLYTKFSQFGVMLKPPRCVRSPTTGLPKGFAFIHYSSFEAADAAIAAMNGQLVGRRRVILSYSFKHKQSKEPHGCNVERAAAEQKTKPNTPPIDIIAPNPFARLTTSLPTHRFIDSSTQTQGLTPIASDDSAYSSVESPINYPVAMNYPGSVYSVSPPMCPQNPVEVCCRCGSMGVNNYLPYAQYFPYVQQPLCVMPTVSQDEIVRYE